MRRTGVVIRLRRDLNEAHEATDMTPWLRQRLSLVAAFVAGQAVMLGAMMLLHGKPAEAQTSKTLVAETLVLRTTPTGSALVMSAPLLGDPYIALTDALGRTRLQLQLKRGQPSVMAFNINGQAIALIGDDGSGNGVVAVADRRGRLKPLPTEQPVIGEQLATPRFLLPSASAPPPVRPVPSSEYPATPAGAIDTTIAGPFSGKDRDTFILGNNQVWQQMDPQEVNVVGNEKPLRVRLYRSNDSEWLMEIKGVEHPVRVRRISP